jgi:PAT family beta-lactamase induction signal transducer AmpG
MYAAQGFEYLCSGLGNGAFGVLLLRLTQKRFSATQYALLSSLFTIPRVIAGPPAGLLADALGWRDFFVFTLLTGVPGLVMLQRFVPWGLREPEFEVAPPAAGRPPGRLDLVRGGAAACGLTAGLSLVTLAGVAQIKAYRAGHGFDLGAGLLAQIQPQGLGDWTALFGVAVVAVLAGLGTAAAMAARGGTPAPVAE